MEPQGAVGVPGGGSPNWASSPTRGELLAVHAPTHDRWGPSAPSTPAIVCSSWVSMPESVPMTSPLDSRAPSRTLPLAYLNLLT